MKLSGIRRRGDNDSNRRQRRAQNNQSENEASLSAENRVAELLVACLSSETQESAVALAAGRRQRGSVALRAAAESDSRPSLTGAGRRRRKEADGSR